jgi:hypothetical protein
VESYDATLEGDFAYYSLRDAQGIFESANDVVNAVKDGHYSGDLDRSWRNGELRVLDIVEVKDDASNS